MSDYKFVSTGCRDHVGVIALNRPEELNTLHSVQGREMREAFAAAQQRVAHKEAVRAFVGRRSQDIYKAIRED